MARCPCGGFGQRQLGANLNEKHNFRQDRLVNYECSIEPYPERLNVTRLAKSTWPFQKRYSGNAVLFGLVSLSFLRVGWPELVSRKTGSRMCDGWPLERWTVFVATRSCLSARKG
jgi:hypothetical protein